MIVLTGGFGFIGSNILKRLNQLGEDDVLVVDNLKGSFKFGNLVGCRFKDYLDKEDFLGYLERGAVGPVRGFLHQGACTDTQEYDGRYMMKNNFEYSKKLLQYAVSHQSPFIYASSAAVYGQTEVAKEDAGNETPLNIYGYSKYLFDRYARRVMANADSTIVGLRYFNTYGPGEAHKGKMSSMVLQLFNQIAATGVAKLFGGYGPYGPGEQTRDFVFVDDVVDLNMFFWHGGVRKTVVNCGSGESRSWNDLARAVIESVGFGRIEYVDFPSNLVGKYQLNTRADLAHLRSMGYERKFVALEDGVREYVRVLHAGHRLQAIEPLSDSRLVPGLTEPPGKTDYT